MTISHYFIADPAGEPVPGTYTSADLAQIEADELQAEHEADLEERGLDAEGWGTYVVCGKRLDGSIAARI